VGSWYGTASGSDLPSRRSRHYLLRPEFAKACRYRSLYRTETPSAQRRVAAALSRTVSADAEQNSGDAQLVVLVTSRTKA